jgi:hypothetical protein
MLSTNDISSLVNKAKDIVKNAKNIAMPQAWNMLQLAVAEIIQNIENNNPNLKGADKKTLALTMISSFYDQVFPIVTFPFAPPFLQPIIQRYVKQLLMILVGASIDALVSTFRQTGVFVDPSSLIVPENDKSPKISEK